MKCAACENVFEHDYQYRNDAAGISLCQKCSYKIAKHYVDGWAASYETNAKIARKAQQFITMLGKVDEENNEPFSLEADSSNL